MSLFDRTPHKRSLGSLERERAAPTLEDARAVDEYESLALRNVGSGVEPDLVRAFEKLTAAQLDEMFVRFRARCPLVADRQNISRRPGIVGRMFRAIVSGLAFWGMAVGPHTIALGPYGFAWTPESTGGGPNSSLGES